MRAPPVARPVRAVLRVHVFGFGGQASDVQALQNILGLIGALSRWLSTPPWCGLWVSATWPIELPVVDERKLRTDSVGTDKVKAP
jgi:hypothetical protein